MKATERFEAKVEHTDGCWYWRASLSTRGYGFFAYEGRSQLAHRVSYMLYVGAIPDGLTVDHRCHNEDPLCSGGVTCPHRACVRPDHLEAVPILENRMRGRRSNQHKDKVVCMKGHALDEQNTYVTPEGYRKCRICKRVRACEYKRRKDGYYERNVV